MRVLLFLTTLVLPSLVFADAGGEHNYGPGMMWGGMGFGPIVMIVVIAAVVVLIALLVRWLGGVGQHGSNSYSALHGKRPLDILKERYARGEIDKEEFEERQRTLES